MSGRIAIVTGAAAGIGAAIAQRLLADGHKVLGVDRQAAERPPEHDDYAALEMDLTVSEAPEAICAAASSRFGGPASLLVNNAGIGGSRAVHETDEERWRHILDVNLTALFRLTKAALAPMMEAGEGAIVNVSSVFGLVGYRNNSAYAASKAAIVGLTRQMAADYGPRGIRVNAVAPGLIRTAMTDELMKDPTYRHLMFEGTPLARAGTPEDVAAAVSFLLSREAGFITGEVLGVDGGWRSTRVSLAS